MRYRVTNRGKIVIVVLLALLAFLFYLVIGHLKKAPEIEAQDAPKNELEIREQKDSFIQSQNEKLSDMEEKIKEHEAALQKESADLKKTADRLAEIQAAHKELAGLIYPNKLTLFFEPNKATVDAVYFESLDKLVRILKYIDYREIRIEGNIYSVRKEGPTDFAEELAEKRAQVVLDYLADQGIKRDKMKVINNLNEKPFMDNGKYAVYGAFNRRVDIVVMP